MEVTEEQAAEARAGSERDAQNLFAGKNDGGGRERGREILFPLTRKSRHSYVSCEVPMT